MLHAYARFRRGEGFGNRLFPWARARVWARRHGLPVLAPRWTRLSVGALLRGGIDLAAYRTQIALLGVFRPAPGDVVGARRRALLRGAPFREEPRDLLAAPDAPAGDEVAVFEGYERFFAPLAGEHEALRAALLSITRPAWARIADRCGTVAVAMNVRCGHDFRRAPPRGGRLAFGEQTPIAWFADLLRAIRRAAGRDVPAFVVSDGTRARLADLLALPATTFVRPGCAASDLLVLSRARVLLASGSSSFSAWGAFLGGMPVATHPGQPLSAWGFSPRGDAVHAEVDASSPAPAFLAAAAHALRGA